MTKLICAFSQKRLYSIPTGLTIAIADVAREGVTSLRACLLMMEWTSHFVVGESGEYIPQPEAKEMLMDMNADDLQRISADLQSSIAINDLLGGS